MSKENYELELQADQMKVEVFNKGGSYYYRVNENGMKELPEDFDNTEVGPYQSYTAALKAATGNQEISTTSRNKSEKSKISEVGISVKPSKSSYYEFTIKNSNILKKIQNIIERYDADFVETILLTDEELEASGLFTKEELKSLRQGWEVQKNVDAWTAVAFYGYSAHDELMGKGIIS